MSLLTGCCDYRYYSHSSNIVKRSVMMGLKVIMPHTNFLYPHKLIWALWPDLSELVCRALLDSHLVSSGSVAYYCVGCWTGNADVHEFHTGGWCRLRCPGISMCSHALQACLLIQIDDDVALRVEKLGFDHKNLIDCLHRREQTKVCTDWSVCKSLYVHSQELRGQTVVSLLSGSFILAHVMPSLVVLLIFLELLVDRRCEMLMCIGVESPHDSIVEQLLECLRHGHVVCARPTICWQSFIFLTPSRFLSCWHEWAWCMWTGNSDVLSPVG